MLVAMPRGWALVGVGRRMIMGSREILGGGDIYM